jgi:Flp pilus assembly protein TadG
VKLCAPLRRFARAREGLAALEFALIAPMMIVLLLTSMEIINLLQTNRRVENTAASIADVISRDTEVTNSEMTGLWSAIAPLMFPDNVIGLDIRVTSISIDASSRGTAMWSEQCGVVASGACGGSTFADIPDNSRVAANQLPAVNVPNTSLIRVEIAYDFRPMLGFFTLNNEGELGADTGLVVLRQTAFRRSRLVDPIPRVVN